MINPYGLRAQRLLLSLTLLLSAGVTFVLFQQASQLGMLPASRRWLLLVGLASLATLLVGSLLAMTWSKLWRQVPPLLAALEERLGKLGRVNLVFFALLMGIYCFLILSPLGLYLTSPWLRLGLFWVAAWKGALLLKEGLTLKSWPAALGLSVVLGGLIYRVAAFLPEISTYPFSLGWSEASRFYYASLYFSEKVYGAEAAASVLHPSRYLLQSIPYLIAELPLWVHRAWQVFLWISSNAITAVLLARRLDIPARGKRWLWLGFFAWSFLFLLQGPVYYHLLVTIALVLAGFDHRRPLQSTLVVVLASAWAGISRINWYPVPGMLAAVLFIVETSFTNPSNGGLGFSLKPKDLQRSLAYFAWPLLWVFGGTLSAFFAQAGYVLWSGAAVEEFASSFTSDLLWYRLLPNPTFPMGVIASASLASLPLSIVAFGWLSRLHILRRLAVWAILLVLFAGGLVVSTKIGGGSNLHNLDAFLALLWVAGTYAWFGKVVEDQPISGDKLNASWQSGWLAAAITVMPVLYAVMLGGPQNLPAAAEAQKALEKISREVAQAAASGGEVLFISQRQLLTFGLVPTTPLVEKYENVYLMEMAMSGNHAYLDTFYAELADHKFALIITDPLRENLKGPSAAFGEENDVWVERVSRPVLTYYKRNLLLKEFGIELLEPKPSP